MVLVAILLCAYHYGCITRCLLGEAVYRCFIPDTLKHLAFYKQEYGIAPDLICICVSLYHGSYCFKLSIQLLLYNLRWVGRMHWIVELFSRDAYTCTLTSRYTLKVLGMVGLRT